MSARFLTRGAASVPLSRCQTFLSLPDQRECPISVKRLWRKSERHPRGAALPCSAGLRLYQMLDTTVKISLLDSLALPDEEGIVPTTLASKLSTASCVTGVRAQAGGGEGREPATAERSNVRHIRGILPVVYKQRVMENSSKRGQEIMFATGNANKLREVSATAFRACKSVHIPARGCLGFCIYSLRRCMPAAHRAHCSTGCLHGQQN